MIGLGAVVETVKTLAGPVTNLLGKHNERRKDIDIIRATAAAGARDAENQVNMTKAQWEVIGQKLTADSWKDEFVTIVVFAPFVTQLAGAVLASFGHPQLADASAAMMASIAAMDIEYGRLLYVTAGAAIGLRWLKR